MLVLDALFDHIQQISSADSCTAANRCLLDHFIGAQDKCSRYFVANLFSRL
jgi:hypothetical protein